MIAIVTGKVVSGYKKSRLIGLPTANIALSQQLSCHEGSYVGQARIEDQSVRYPSLIFYGRPHILPNVSEPRFEVYIFGESVDLYGKRLTVTLERFIRPNQKFEEEEDLVKAIKDDVQKATCLLGLSKR